MELIENKISYDVRKCAFKVHKELGPGLLESVYEKALSYELKLLGYDVKNQYPVPVFYKGKMIENAFRIDILVDDLVVLEIKSVEKLMGVNFKQLLTFLKLSDKKLGLLINFNTKFLTNKESIIRVVNNL